MADCSFVKVGDQDTYELSFSSVQAGVDDRLNGIKVGTGMTVSSTAGGLTIASGTTVNSETILRSKQSFCGSLRLLFNMVLSQRIANHNTIVELVDVLGDGLAYSITNTTTVVVTVPEDTFTYKDIGKKLWIANLSSVGTPVQATIAAVGATTVTLTVVAWPASGSGTCSLFGLSMYQVLYDGTTATTGKYDTSRNGWGSSASSVTINTTAAPGHVVSIHNDNGWARMSDCSASNSNAFTQRGARLMNTPDVYKDLYLQIRVLNGATAPASTTTSTVNFVRIERFNGQQVTLAGDKVVDLPQAVSISGTPTFTAQGAAAQDATVSGNPVLVGYEARTSNPAAVSASGDTVRQIANMIGVSVVLPYAIPESTWQYAAASGGIVNTTDVAIKAAAAAGIRNYLTGLTVRNSHATVATEVVVKDGSTVIWREHCPANSPEYQITFPNPLRGGAATALNVACITTGAAVYVNAQGFTAP